MASKIKKDFLYSLAYQVLIVVLPLITTPYISRVLGSEGVGIFGFTNGVISYFILFGTLGITLYGRREIAYKQKDRKTRTELFWQINIIKWITLAISMAVYFFTCVKSSEFGIYYKIFSIELLAAALDISWYYQGLERFKTIAIRNMIIKISSVALIFLFVKRPEDLWLYILIFTCSNLVSNLSLWLFLPKTLDKVKLKASELKKHIMPIFSLFIPQIAIEIYLVLDKIMLGLLTNNMNEVGIYEQSQKLERLSLQIITALTPVMAMRIASLFSEKKSGEIKEKLQKSFHFAWFLSTPIALGIAGVATNMVPWFLGEQFMGAIPVMQIGCVIVFAVALNSTSGQQYFIPANKQNVITISTFVAAAANFFGNLLLIPHLQAVGAIITSVAAECIVTGVQFHYMKGVLSLRQIFKPTLKCVPCGLLMLAAVAFSGLFLPQTIIGTFTQIIIGAIVYISAMTIARDAMMLEIWETVRGTIWKITHKKAN